MLDNTPLFKPFIHNKIELPNRIVMAPMTRNQAPGGQVNQKMIDYYVRRAEGGVGFIITEASCINHAAASGYPNVPFIGRDNTLEGWRQLVDAVHAAGSKIAVQLWHVGGIRKPGIEPGGELPGYSPSGMIRPGKVTGHTMSATDIQEVIAAYAQAASQARDAGFDAIEIHGAHGYLIDQFFWSGTNQRDDAYGGSMPNRSQFGIEVTQAIRAAVGEDMALIMRFSQWKQQDYAAQLCTTPEQLGEFVLPLRDAGIDFFHCSERRFWEPQFDGSDLNLAGWVKKITGLPVITVGSIGLDNDFLPDSRAEIFGEGGTANIDGLIERLEAGEFDLAAVGRALIANPDWANKVRDDASDQLVAFEKEMLFSLK